MPLILLHGFLGAKENLGQIGRALSDAFTVYAVDLRNHGASPHTETISYPEMAQDVVDFMKERGIESATVLGHSMGGKVAMEVALSFPERIKRLIVADIAPIAYGSKHEAILAALIAAKGQQFKSRTAADKVLAQYIEEVPVRQFLLTNLVRPDDVSEYLVWRINIPTLVTQYKAVAAAPSNGIYQHPTLFIKGELSDYVRNAYTASIMLQFPNALIETINGAGHWLHVEKTNEFIEVVRRFLGG